MAINTRNALDPSAFDDPARRLARWCEASTQPKAPSQAAGIGEPSDISQGCRFFSPDNSKQCNARRAASRAHDGVPGETLRSQDRETDPTNRQTQTLRAGGSWRAGLGPMR